MAVLDLSPTFLTLDFQGDTIQLPYCWLYDNRPQNRATNGQKLTETVDLPLDILPETVSIEDDFLLIQWPGDESLIKYDLEKIQSVFSRKEHHPNYWTADNLTLRAHNYKEISSDPGARWLLLDDIVQNGLGVISQVPEQSEMVCEVAEWFSYVRTTNYGRYFDVKVVPDPNNLAYTAKGLPPHTDNPYRDPVPTLQLLHCLKADASGGDSILIDGFKMAEDLRALQPAYFELLSRQLIWFAFADDEVLLEHLTTVIGLRPDGRFHHIRFNNRSVQPFPMQSDVLLAYYEAYQAWEQMMHDPTYTYLFKLQPGDLIIFDNERILHGRTEYTLHGERHLQGCYADRDGLLSAWKNLKR